MRLFFIVVWVAFLAMSLSAQQPYSLKVISYPTKAPVSGAQIAVEDSVYLTSALGDVSFLASPNTLVEIQHDSLRPHLFYISEAREQEVFVDIKQEFLDYEFGMDLFMLELKQIKYPLDAIKYGLNGLIMVYFTINEEGEALVDTNVKSRKTKILEREVMKVLQGLNGNWPKSYAGTTFTLPVLFRISGKKTPLNSKHFEPKGYLLEQIDLTGFAVRQTKTIKN